jgi:hypothetical protein
LNILSVDRVSQGREHRLLEFAELGLILRCKHGTSGKVFDHFCRGGQDVGSGEIEEKLGDIVPERLVRLDSASGSIIQS